MNLRVHLCGAVVCLCVVLILVGCGGSGRNSDLVKPSYEYGVDLADGRRAALTLVSRLIDGEVVSWLPDGTVVDRRPPSDLEQRLFKDQGITVAYRFDWYQTPLESRHRVYGLSPSPDNSYVDTPGSESLDYGADFSTRIRNTCAGFSRIPKDREAVSPTAVFRLAEFEPLAIVSYRRMEYEEIGLPGKSGEIIFTSTERGAGYQQSAAVDWVSNLQVPRPETIRGVTIISVSLKGLRTYPAVRVVESSGRIRKAYLLSGVIDEDELSAVYTVKGVNSGDIKDIEIGTLRLQEVFVENVSLRPGEKTKPNARITGYVPLTPDFFVVPF